MKPPYAVTPLTRPFRATVEVPGSKSQTNRALLLAALADGPSTLDGALFSQDSRVFVDSLRRLGLRVDTDETAASITVAGAGGRIPAARAELFVANAGTAARFLTAFLTLGRGEYLLDGVQRMRERPIGDLLDALTALGGGVESVRHNGCPPVRVRAAGLAGGEALVAAGRSGQFLSALLLVAPYARRPTTLRLESAPASLPYIEMTVAMMRAWGVPVEVSGDPDRASPERPAAYRLPAPAAYVARRYSVPPDASGASYFLAAAAVTGGSVRVRNLALADEQGDLGLLRVFERMGCLVSNEGRDILLSGPRQLDGVDLDLNGMSDTAMTLAAVAPFARGPVVLRNIAHIREKETDRLAAITAELRRLGGRVEERADGLTVFPSPLHGAEVRTYDDHRMAMAFAITGLLVPGLSIAGPECVAKTFPDFFSRLEDACRQSLEPGA
jgi:3-phosphoshikimate 1-carboxyvinyltransferase